MNKKGFTLIELLATIVVLALIFSIAIYVTTTAINKSKENTYKVTINEVEKNASSYLIENSNRLFYLSKDEDNEYQCTTVENLVDYGYLDNEVTKSLVDKNRYVSYEDYIYIERTKSSKVVTKAIYVKDGTEEARICPKAMIALGDIAFLINPNINTWSRYKDITIIYRLKNLNDQRKISDYKFNYEYVEGTSEYNPNNDTLENNIKVKHVRVTSNGTLIASINYGSEEPAKNTLVVSKIDNIGPVITKGNYTGSEKVRSTVTFPLKVTDKGIGVDASSFTKDDIIVKVGDTTIKDITLTKVNDNNYNLKINSDSYNGKVSINIPSNSVLDKLANGNNNTNIDTGITFDNTYKISYNVNGGTGTIEDTKYLYATSGNVKLSTIKPIKKGYNLLGWNTDKNANKALYTSGGDYPRNIKKDVILYAIWTLASYNCNAGYYLKKTDTSCTICTKNYYCVGGTYYYNTTTDQGITACPSGTYTERTGASSSSQCLMCNRWVRLDNQNILRNQVWNFYRDCRLISGSYTYKDYNNETYTLAVTNGTGWIFTGQRGSNPDGQETSTKRWYYLEDNVMVVGWKKIGNFWYFFADTDPDGNGAVNGDMLYDTSLVWNNKTYKFDKYGHCINDNYKCN